MSIYKVTTKTKVMLVETFEVEAESEQGAIDLYCNKLAGDIEPINWDTRPCKEGSSETITAKLSD